MGARGDNAPPAFLLPVQRGDADNYRAAPVWYRGRPFWQRDPFFKHRSVRGRHIGGWSPVGAGEMVVILVVVCRSSECRRGWPQGHRRQSMDHARWWKRRIPAARPGTYFQGCKEDRQRLFL